MTSDISVPAPVLSTNSLFYRTEQLHRKDPKILPHDLISKFSLDLVAKQILDFQLAKLSDDQPSSCKCSSSDTPSADTKSKCAPVKPPQKTTAVALQFPDKLIPDSAYITQELNRQLESLYTSPEFSSTQLTIPRLFVLGDSSYSPCCVDVVAAQHIHAHIIVHFGTACLNPVANAQVIYVFGKEKLGFIKDSLLGEIKKSYENEPDIENVVLVYDPEFEYELDGFVKTNFDKTNKDSNFQVTNTLLKRPSDSSVIIPDNNSFAQNENTDPSLLQIPGRSLESNDLDTDEFLNSGSIFYVTYGTPSPSYLLHLTTLASRVFIIDGTSSEPRVKTPETSLQRRYRSMNEARMASTIGILINTLSLRDVGDAITRIQQWITAAGKKYYTFVVGKPNVPKLANFDVVDVWVVLGCPRGGIIMSNNGGQDPDYYKPIITPYELKLALQPMVTWTGKWAIQLENVLNNMRNLGLDDDEEETDFMDKQNNDPIDDDESEPPEFDPVTGKYVSTSRPLHTRRITHLDVQTEEEETPNDGLAESNATKSKGLVVRHSSHLVIRNTVSTAADHLYNKLSWTGLGSDFKEVDEEEGGEKRYAQVERGRGGVARSYGIVDDHSNTN